ncbi:hypothetical protein KJE20_00005 [Pyrenophora tritici-repentis]|nr:hypothetical protein KJE20_00005 [Pyrenophora tritici-repentis]
MSSQETIPDDTLYQGYQNCPVVRDDTVYPASEPAEPARASKQSGDKKNDEQLGECASRETRGTASYINASKIILPMHRPVLRNHVGNQPQENGTEVADLLDELNDLMGRQKHISSMVDDVVSRLQEALKQTTHRSLPKGGKLVRWADSASAHGPNDDTHRPRKRARGN